MSEENKLPSNEASGTRRLHGIYHVSFDIAISSNDDLTITDVTQAIASGFSDSPVLSKIADLNITKNLKPVDLKIGDTIMVKEDTSVKVSLFSDSIGNIVAGKEFPNFKFLGETTLKVTAGSRAVVNKLDNETVECISFDTVSYAELQDPETDEILDSQIFLDNVTLQNSAVEKDMD